MTRRSGAALLVLALSGCAPQEKSVDELMSELAREGAAIARERYELELDYSPASVETVEQILTVWHDLHRAGEVSEAVAARQAELWGAYVGEVIRRDRGGSWARDHEVVGPGTFPLAYEGHESFPLAWCWNRIVNGPEDNVWVKYQHYVVGRQDLDVEIIEHDLGGLADAED